MKLWECTAVSCLPAQLRGPFCRILLLAHFSDRHTLSLYQPAFVTGKQQQHICIMCLYKQTHGFTHIVSHCSSQILHRPLCLTGNIVNFISKRSAFTSKYQNTFKCASTPDLFGSVKTISGAFFRLVRFIWAGVKSVSWILVKTTRPGLPEDGRSLQSGLLYSSFSLRLLTMNCLSRDIVRDLYKRCIYSWKSFGNHGNTYEHQLMHEKRF